MEKILTFDVVEKNIKNDTNSYHYKINKNQNILKGNIRFLRINLNIAIFLLFITAFLNYINKFDFLLDITLLYFLFIFVGYVYSKINYYMYASKITEDKIKELEIKNILNNKDEKDIFIRTYF